MTVNEAIHRASIAVPYVVDGYRWMSALEAERYGKKMFGLNEVQINDIYYLVRCNRQGCPAEIFWECNVKTLPPTVVNRLAGWQSIAPCGCRCPQHHILDPSCAHTD